MGHWLGNVKAALRCVKVPTIQEDVLTDKRAAQDGQIVTTAGVAG